jgi:hypothetical protein
LKALLILIFLGVVVLGLVQHLACRPAFIEVPTGHPLPKHYMAKWVFGNVTVVQVAPSHTEVSIGPWP